LADFIFWLAVVCCIVAQAAIVRSSLSGSTQTATPLSEVPRPKRSIEIAWTILPALALAAVLVVTWRAIHTPAISAQPPFSLERTQ
jgi:hypothetical protein